ncbi:MAG: Asp-tRNA(Asn)/Glu-tRNA(Gln) amidotransferase subunit GatA [Candidatus Berkelbacteria bacterium]
MSELYKLTIKEASDKLASGEITSVELTEAIFKRISVVEPLVGAYITLCEDRAMEMAKKSDADFAVSHKRKSLVDGVPIAVKDLFLTKGVRTTAASKILEDFIPVNESEVTRRLWEAGAVLVGKTNMDQFAMGSSTESSAYKTATKFDRTTTNPIDHDRVPGGSSGGSAAAVVADMCIAAIGTDTGGSIRQPASHCGIVGLKPTYGKVSRKNVIAMASSLDQAGPMTKTVGDAKILLDIIAGKDEGDSTSTENRKQITGNGKLKIGIPKEFFGEGLDPRINSIIQAKIEELKNAGHEIVPVSMPMSHFALAAYYIIMPAEVSSNLARYDGIRYGHSVLKETGDRNQESGLLDVYMKSRAEGFGAEAKRRIMLGSYVLSAGYFDAYYKKALKVRTLIKREFEEIFSQVDLLLTPVTPNLAPKFGENDDDPLRMYLSDIMTISINLAGVPAMSVPAGTVSEDGKDLPVGVQVIGPMWGEERIFALGKEIEKRG